MTAVSCKATVGEPPYYIREHDCPWKASESVELHGVRYGVCKKHATQFAKNPTGCGFSWGWTR